MNETTRRLLALMKERKDLADRVDRLEEVALNLRDMATSPSYSHEFARQWIANEVHNVLLESTR